VTGAGETRTGETGTGPSGPGSDASVGGSDPIRDEASSASTLSRPASSATPSNQPRPDRDGGNDQPWPPSSWPSQT